MSFNSTAASVGQQVSYAQHAWIPLVLIVSAMAFAIWKIVQWQHGAVLAHKDAEISTLKRQLDASQASTTAASVNSKPEATTPGTECADASAPASGIPTITALDSTAEIDAADLARMLRSGAPIASQRKAIEYVGRPAVASGNIASINAFSETVFVTLDASQPNVQVILPLYSHFLDDLAIGQSVRAHGRIAVASAAAIALDDIKTIWK